MPATPRRRASTAWAGTWPGRSMAAGALLSVALLTVAATAAGAGSARGAKGSGARVVNACRWSVDAFYRDLTVTLAAGADGTGRADAKVELDSVRASAKLPGSLVAAGFNVGFLTLGRNELPLEIAVAVGATNTREQVQVVRVSTVASTTVSMRKDEPKASAIAVDVVLPATSWTATGGEVKFSQAAPGHLPVITGVGVRGADVSPEGSVFIHTKIGTAPVNLDCAPGTQNPDSRDGQPPFTTYVAAKRWGSIAVLAGTKRR